MPKNISGHIPPAPPKALVKAQVRKDLRDQTEAILDTNHWTWVQFVEAAMEAFIEEHKKGRKS